jgi:nicotinate-nucleotide adenylyltransferase
MYNIKAVYGGAFDPIHKGHIETALNICKHLQLQQLFLLPCGQPVFKKGCQASPQQRLDMLNLAIKDYPNIKIDTRELEKTSPSYTIETLKELRSETSPNRPIVFILGQDAFQHFFQWRDWENILEYCHLMVLSRPAIKKIFHSELKKFILKQQTNDPMDLIRHPNGFIYEWHAGDYPYSSSNIKAALQHQEPPLGLDNAVLKYIQKHHLYSNDS